MKVQSDWREGLRYWVQSRISNFNEALDEVRSFPQREAWYSEQGAVDLRETRERRADFLEVRLEEARAEHARLQTSNAHFEQRWRRS